MIVHLSHDRQGRIVSAAVVAPGMHVAIGPKTAKRLKASTIHVADVVQSDLHHRLHDIASNFTVHAGPSGVVLRPHEKPRASGRRRR